MEEETHQSVTGGKKQNFAFAGDLADAGDAVAGVTNDSRNGATSGSSERAQLPPALLARHALGQARTASTALRTHAGRWVSDRVSNLISEC